MRGSLCTRAVRNTRVTAEPERICFSVATDGRIEENRRRRECLWRFLPLRSRSTQSRPAANSEIAVSSKRKVTSNETKVCLSHPGRFIYNLIGWTDGRFARLCNLFHISIKMDRLCRAAKCLLLALPLHHFSVSLFIAIKVNVKKTILRSPQVQAEI